MGDLSCRTLANTTSHIFHSRDYSLCVLKVQIRHEIVTQKYINTVQRFDLAS